MPDSQDVSIQSAPFDVAAEIAALDARLSGRAGAVVTFTGLCRDEGGRLKALELEHYPGMAEAEIGRVAAEARARWPLLGLRVVHRHGLVAPGDGIVFVATASAHRAAAFEAASFLMDYLKTRAPFWKREHLADGTLGGWVEATGADDDAAGRWACAAPLEISRAPFGRGVDRAGRSASQGPTAAPPEHEKARMTDRQTKAADETVHTAADPWPFLRAGVGTVAFVVVLSLAWISVSTLLLIFSGVLLGVFLDGLTRGLAYVAPLPRALRLTLASLAIAAAALGMFAYGGATVAQQGRDLGETVRKQADTVTGWLSAHGIDVPALGAPAPKPEGQSDAGKGDDGSQKPGGLGGLATSVLKSPGSILSDAGSVLGPAASVILAIFGALGNVLVIGFLGLAFAADPKSYRDGILHFVPPARRRRGARVLDGMGGTLRHWLFGQLVTMTVIFLCIWGGLTLLGVGGALILGLQAGLLAFVPTVGPLVAGLVILLASLSQGTNAMLGALGVYLAVQCLESYILTPLIQKRALDIPPATIFAGQLLLGGLLGLWGIALALPLMAVMKVLLEQLYVEEGLGEEGSA